MGGIEQDHVAADFTFQLRGRAQGHQVAFIHDGEAVTALGFFHEMRGDEHRDVFLVAQRPQVLPEIAPGAGIEAGGGLIEQQHSGMMQQSFGQLDAALHAAGKSFDQFLAAIGQADAAEDFLNPVLQGGAAQTVEMSLMPEILVGGEFEVDALGLKDHADLATQTRRLARGIATHDGSAPRGRKHKSGKNAEECGLAAAVGAEQSEQFRRTHVEGNAIQSRAVAVAMHQVLDGNDGCEGRRSDFRSGVGECGNFRYQEAS